MDYSMQNQAELLTTLIQSLQINIATITTAQLQDVADRLSVIAKKNPKWTWRYLRNILNGKMNASRKLMKALYQLGAIIDQTPTRLVMGENVLVIALGKVANGALVLADSKKCDNPGCGIEFIPRSPNQRYCCIDCRKIDMKRKRA